MRYLSSPVYKAIWKFSTAAHTPDYAIFSFRLMYNSIKRKCFTNGDCFVLNARIPSSSSVSQQWTSLVRLLLQWMTSQLLCRKMRRTLHAARWVYYSAHDREAAYCDERVCLSVCMCVCVCVCLCVAVCLTAIIPSGLHIRSSPKFLCMSPMAVARSSSGGALIRYVLPVLWMTSCLHISQGCSTLPPSWSAVRTQPWAWL